LHAKTEFGISHFAGPVTYEAAMFMERNTDKLQRGLLSLAAMSSNALIQAEFKSQLEEHVVNDTAGVVKKKATSMTLLEKFRNQLRDLMAAMEGSQTRYIRCIKPNNTMAPKVIDQLMVFRQLQCAGLVTAIDLSRGIFPNKLPYVQVEERFACLMNSGHLHATRDMELHDKVHLMVSILFAPLIERFGDNNFSMPFACGKTRVYFRSGALETLEALRQEFLSKYAILLQRWDRKLRVEHRYSRFRKAVIQMQSLQRTHLARSLYRKTKQAVTSIQTWVRLLSAMSRYQQSKKAAIVLGAWGRSRICLIRFHAMKRAATILETWGRSHIVSTRFNRTKKTIMSLQARTRGYPERARFQTMRAATVAVQTWARVQLATEAVRRYRQEAVLELANLKARVIQVWWRCVAHRLANALQERELLKFAAVQAWWQEREAAAAAVIQSWSKIRLERIHFQQKKEAAAAAVIQSRSRARLERIHFQHKKKASSFVQTWYRAVITRRAGECNKKKATALIQTWYRTIITQRIEYGKRRVGDEETLSEIKKAWRLHLEGPSIGALDSEHTIDQEVTTLSIYRQESATRKASRGSQLYEEEIAALREEIQQVTSEAEMHLQEVQRDFEDKLVEYEDEVLQSNQTIRHIQQEKMILQEQLATAQQSYVMNIQRLKKGMRKSHDSHKEYLGKVMGVLEEANSARRAEAERITRELASVKQEKDARIAGLEEELDLLRKLGVPVQRNEVEVDDTSAPGGEQATDGKVDKKVRRIIQKLEKVLSPDNILEVVCAAQRQPGCTTPYIENKISSKCSKLIGRLENLTPRKEDVKEAAAQFDSKKEDRIDTEKEKIIEQLQQQLVWAYEEVESLQNELGEKSEDAQGRRRERLFGRNEG
jgi:hypothetical protein